MVESDKNDFGGVPVKKLAELMRIILQGRLGNLHCQLILIFLRERWLLSTADLLQQWLIMCQIRLPRGQSIEVVVIFEHRPILKTN